MCVSPVLGAGHATIHYTITRTPVGVCQHPRATGNYALSPARTATSCHSDGRRDPFISGHVYRILTGPNSGQPCSIKQSTHQREASFTTSGSPIEGVCVISFYDRLLKCFIRLAWTLWWELASA